MAVIINLSTLITLKPDQDLYSAFKRLSDTYSTDEDSYVKSLLPGILSSPISAVTDYAWVTSTISDCYETLIVPYKLGKISTQDFLDGFRKSFDFIEKNIDYHPKEKTRIRDNREKYACLRDKGVLKKVDFARALIEEAWASAIEFTEQDYLKFDQLNQTINEDIYFITDGTELGMYKVVEALKKRFPNYDWLSPAKLDNDGILQIAPHMFICSSHLAHTFKTTKENQHQGVKSISLIKHLINARELDPKYISLVSESDDDFVEGYQVGIPHDNMILPQPKTHEERYESHAGAFYPDNDGDIYYNSSPKFASKFN